ncbi:MAG: hypothetical protein NXI32_29275, partial [bacterium]|nr:hypothetical protein [bacterium]
LPSGSWLLTRPHKAIGSRRYRRCQNQIESESIDEDASLLESRGCFISRYGVSRGSNKLDAIAGLSST